MSFKWLQNAIEVFLYKFQKLKIVQEVYKISKRYVRKKKERKLQNILED